MHVPMHSLHWFLLILGRSGCVFLIPCKFTNFAKIVNFTSKFFDFSKFTTLVNLLLLQTQGTLAAIRAESFADLFFRRILAPFPLASETSTFAPFAICRAVGAALVDVDGRRRGQKSRAASALLPSGPEPTSLAAHRVLATLTRGRPRQRQRR